MVTGWGRWWDALVARRRARMAVDLTWRICRRCGSYSFLSTGLDPLCGSCRCLQ
jgi:hypothetical protein